MQWVVLEVLRKNGCVAHEPCAESESVLASARQIDTGVTKATILETHLWRSISGWVARRRRVRNAAAHPDVDICRDIIVALRGAFLKEVIEESAEDAFEEDGTHDEVAPSEIHECARNAGDTTGAAAHLSIGGEADGTPPRFSTTSDDRALGSGPLFLSGVVGGDGPRFACPPPGRCPWPRAPSV